MKKIPTVQLTMVREKGDDIQIRTHTDVANLLMLDMSLLPQESLRVVLLNTRNNVTGVSEIYKGSVNTIVVRVAEVLRPAIIGNATSIILVHNHPSGDPTPSPEDVTMTKMVKEACTLFDIELLDHIVIGDNKFVSMKDKGLI